MLASSAVAWASDESVYSWWTLYDIEVYRSAGLAVWQGRDTLYASEPGSLPFTYPPVAAVLFVPLALLPMPWAALALSLSSLLALAGTVRMALGRRSGWAAVAGVTAAAVLSEPVLATLDLGQVNLVLMALVMIDLTVRPGARWHGIPIAVAVCVKLTPLIFLVVFLLRRDARSLLRAGLTVGAGALVGLLVLPESSRAYLAVAGQAGRVGTPDFPGNQSLLGALLRLGLRQGPGLGWAAVWAGACAVALLLGAVLLGRLVRVQDRVGQACIAASVGLLVSPISWSHHWVWLVPAAIWLWRNHRQCTAAAVVVVAMTRVMFWSGYQADLADTGSIWQRGASAAYPALALALLAHLARTTRPGQPTSAIAHSAPRAKAWRLPSMR